MATIKANGTWTGGFKDGKGTMKPGHGAEIAFSTATRFEGQEGSNPEEVIGAALAGCYSMALTLDLEKAGFKPQSVATTAEVKTDRIDGKFTIVAIDLTTKVVAPGVDDAKFQPIADGTRKNCPIARVLAAAQINLKATVSG
jgi:osmotically inducible protein OsmC